MEALTRFSYLELLHPLCILVSIYELKLTVIWLVTVATAQRITSLLLHTSLSSSFISNQAFSPLMSEPPNPPVCLPLTVLLIWSSS